MSDGLSEGRRWAEERDESQKNVDAFFLKIIEVALGTMAIGKLRESFLAFDAIRYADHVARGRLYKTKNARWSKFKKCLDHAISSDSLIMGRWGWAEILTLALQYASEPVRRGLQSQGSFRSAYIALYAPNGGGREPDLYGDHEALFDAACGGRGTMLCFRVNDPERGITGVQLGRGGKEIRVPALTKLRFIAFLTSEARRKR